MPTFFLKGQFTIKFKNSFFFCANSTSYQSRHLWNLLSFGDINCRNFFSLSDFSPSIILLSVLAFFPAIMTWQVCTMYNRCFELEERSTSPSHTLLSNCDKFVHFKLSCFVFFFVLCRYCSQPPPPLPVHLHSVHACVLCICCVGFTRPPPQWTPVRWTAQQPGFWIWICSI